jgi:hypothetical protein
MLPKQQYARANGMLELAGNASAVFAPLLAGALIRLDLIYLQPDGDAPNYLRELRLQNLDRLDLGELQRQADLAKSSKLQRAVVVVAELARAEGLEYERL